MRPVDSSYGKTDSAEELGMSSLTSFQPLESGSVTRNPPVPF